MKEIFLSIIIPTYKRSDNLERAINSILVQKGNYEIIVVDDNDNNTKYRKSNEKLMEKYSNNKNIVYLKHSENKNGAAARNTGIKCAKGKYLTFLDDDDEFGIDRIKSIESALKDFDVDFACSGFLVKKNGFIERKVMPNLNVTNRQLQFQLLCQKSFFGTGSNIICKKEIVEKIEGFDEKFIRHQDMEFMIRLLHFVNNKKIIDNYSIIKNTDDTSNIPLFDKLYKTKKMYLEKFSTLMSQYTNEEKNKIIKLNYYELLRNAYDLGDNNEIKKAKKLLKKMKIYNLFDDLYVYIRSRLRRIKLVRFIRSIVVRRKGQYVK